MLLLAGCRDGGGIPPEQGEDSGGPGDTPGQTSSDTGVESLPGRGEPWVRSSTRAPGTATFTELLYDSLWAGDTEWLELHNPMALDLDISGWSLAGGVSYAFPEGTVMPAGSYLVVAADPSAMEDRWGYADAMGPWEGSLSNGGERLELYSNGGRLIDTVEYADDDPWPVQADGSGLTLAKTDPDAASDRAEHWSVSADLGGTPGEANGMDPTILPTTLTLVAEDATWTYDLSGAYPADDWADPDYDDSDWESGQATFYAGEATQDEVATAWATADNYFALYLGQADGSEMRWVGQDTDGSWTTVEEVELELTSEDHLYLAAWELTGDDTSTQMAIAEVELSDSEVGTDADNFEWILGPTDENPGSLPANPAPSDETIRLLVEEANAAGTWELPAVEEYRTSDPWGGNVGDAFTDAAWFIWADTFDSDSITNSEDTYALFRSVEPVIAPQGNMELSEVPTTIPFRTSFSFDADPAATELSLWCTLDDGAVVYLNGEEVLRENMPHGAVEASTLATSAVEDAVEVYAEISGDALVQGNNVLAVELHQAEEDDADLAFGCSLEAETWPASDDPTLLINEVAAAEEAPGWLELLNVSGTSQDTSGLLLLSSQGDEWLLDEGTLAAGELLAVQDLDFDLADGDLLYLYTADESDLLDAVRVWDRVRARADDGGPWRVPAEATPGGENLIELHEDVVIHEIMYHRAPVSQEGEPFAERREEWIELYNRGEEEVDLGGWQLVDAVSFEVPEGTVLEPGAYLVISNDSASLQDLHPHIQVLGEMDGRLDNATDRILLLDSLGNPADEVRYHDGGRWPEAADGGGASLELMDPWADNATAEAWAASDESGRTEWVSYRYSGLAEASAVGPDGTWEELVLGMLDAGEVLIDDISVIQDPDLDPVEVLQNGSFDEGSEHWRLLGNHRHSQVVEDPDDPSNAVLHLVATGNTGHMHNHAETTLLEPIGTREYEISFRARWVSGSNQLHSRLYFNRLPRTTLVEIPERSGTPGEPNATGVDNLGPTFEDFAQDVAVPSPYEPVTLSVTVYDPDGVDAVTLFISVDGDAFEDQAMVEGGDGLWEATLEGQEAGAIVQVYLEAEDSRGAVATFPADGADSRALLTFDDGQAEDNGLHNLRILMTEEDADWLHEEVNLMSNDPLGATVVYDEAEVFYDVGVRMKGSERGRPTDDRVGYKVFFNDDQPFRGSHGSVLIDRSEGVGYGQREVLLNLVMTAAGAVFGEYNDLIQLMAPRSTYTGGAELQLDRFTDLMLASQFADGDAGERYEYELIYYPTTTDDGTAEGLKLPQPDTVVGTSLTDLGDDEEAYRWTFLLKNNEREDDFGPVMTLCQTMGLSDEAFLEATETVLDVDQWLRAFAFATLSGATDQYGGAGSQHNAQFYLRPEDGRMLFFPHDLDYFSSSTMSVVGNSDLAQLLEDTSHARAYYGHLQDIIASAYSTGYLQPWCDQLGELLPGQDFDSHCAFIDDRADWVLYDSSESVMAVYPQVDFRITTEGGADFTVRASEVTLEGEGWVDVREIALEGEDEPLSVTWLDGTTWQVTLSLEEGANDLSLVATDLHGETVGSDSIVVTREGGG